MHQHPSIYARATQMPGQTTIATVHYPTPPQHHPAIETATHRHSGLRPSPPIAKPQSPRRIQPPPGHRSSHLLPSGHRDRTNSHHPACVDTPTTATGLRDCPTHHPASEIASHRHTNAANRMIAPAFPGHRECANAKTRYNVVRKMVKCRDNKGLSPFPPIRADGSSPVW